MAGTAGGTVIRITDMVTEVITIPIITILTIVIEGSLIILPEEMDIQIIIPVENPIQITDRTEPDWMHAQPVRDDTPTRVM